MSDLTKEQIEDIVARLDNARDQRESNPVYWWQAARDTAKALRDVALRLAQAERERQIDRIRFREAEARAEHLKSLLDERDKFIVDHELWNEFVASLPAVALASPPAAAREADTEMTERPTDRTS